MAHIRLALCWWFESSQGQQAQMAQTHLLQGARAFIAATKQVALTLGLGESQAGQD